nr:hypothetical protein [Gammaproteobacteria bacterium]
MCVAGRLSFRPYSILHTFILRTSIPYTWHLILRIHLNRAHSAPANSASGSGRFYNRRWVKLVGRVLVARDPRSGVWRRVLCPFAPVYVTPTQVIIVSACYVHFVPSISAEKGEMGKKGGDDKNGIICRDSTHDLIDEARV